MTDNTEPTIDEIFDTPIKTAPTSDEATMLKLIKSQVEQLISDQVAKARIDEIEQWQRYWKDGKDTRNTDTYVADRINTLNGVNNNG